MIIQNGRQGRKSKYRSIQYRSVSSDIISLKQSISNESKHYLDLKSATKNSMEIKRNKNWFRSQQKFKRGNKIISINVKEQKSQKLENSTMEGFMNPEQKINSSYLQTFDQLMELDCRNYSHRKTGPIYSKIKYRKDKANTHKIILPNIIEYPNSMFSALDPIQIPIKSLTQSLIQLQQQIQQQPLYLQAIRCSIKQTNQTISQELKDIDQKIRLKITELRMKLKQNSVLHQNHTLNIKKQIKQLKEFIPQFKEQFTNCHQKQQSLQVLIFETTPFELQWNKQQEIEQQKSRQNNEISKTQKINYF